MRLAALLSLCAAVALVAAACDDATGPASESTRLVRLVEYPVGGYATRREATFAYTDDRLTRYDHRISEVDGTETRLVRTYYSTHAWSDSLRIRSDIYIRSPDGFVQSSEVHYEYDGAGRLARVVVVTLLDALYHPIHIESTIEYVRDDAGRLVQVLRGDGSSVVIEWGAGDVVAAETLITTEGDSIRYQHDYDDGRNPFHAMESYGIVMVWGSWATYLSSRNLVRTEVSVNGGPVVSVRDVSYESYDERGFPERAIQTFTLVAEPDNPTVFVAEYEYGR